MGIPYVPLPVHSEMRGLTYLGAQSYQKRCLQVEAPVFWGSHLLLACVKGRGSCKALFLEAVLTGRGRGRCTAILRPRISYKR